MRIFLIAIIVSVNVYSQVSNVNLDYYFSQLDKDLNESIPKPQDVIGHNIGDWHVTHDKLVQYMYTLADVSDRISIENRGFTYENRPIVPVSYTHLTLPTILLV